jgi:hypothetical protein
MNSHTIVYLDQNYLSNMAKARVRLIKDKDEAAFWHSLFDCLKEAVLTDKIACPESEFHSTEAQYDTRLEEAIIGTVYELSWGLQFHPWKSILESQIEDAAKASLGQQLEEREWWTIAFKSNPNAPVESRMEDILGEKGRIDIHIPLPDYTTERERRLKSEFVVGAQELLDKHINSRPDDLPEALVQSKKSFIAGYMGNVALQYIAQSIREGSKLDQLVALGNYVGLVDLWGRLRRIGINTDDSNMVMAFAESKELLNSQFIDIFASIYAVVATYYPTSRKIQEGDYYDMAILAAALPYCDIVTTDKFMKEILINKLQFDKKYKSRIFSATKKDRLAFQKLVRALL